MFAYDPYSELATLRDFAPLTLTSDDVADGGALPPELWNPSARDGGADRSPQLSWSGAPAGTKSFAVSVFDPDAPTGSGYWHWAVYDLAPTVTSLAAGVGDGMPGSLPPGAITLPNESRQERYEGAAPPAGTGTHRYFIVVDALDVSHLELPPGATPAILGFNRHFHSLARGVLVGTATPEVG
ncbi:YbhB/YbcL family Raf kinase inhibitor-like protein [Agromyces seonyuensis]|uniref:YbhB/YbcL family Raf kinase inhibitor-like protein n=1 Tax=Agromyces seonyuensis TaxID=2662446 RepID=A0A6I4NVW2_9MICO|nr:YbhB/YbcL family Raf kinase inhibitor-like protein [Agromyces seonyuensis]MWB98576.1 YbhB/YbcL family Raf kinase inhibitor-like protein [Agromyces seonyuensis]